MKLLVKPYAADNILGLPAGWPEECQEVDDKFALDDVPSGWLLVGLDELETLKQPLLPAANEALQAKREAVQKAFEEEKRAAELEKAAATDEPDKSKRAYIDLKQLQLSDGRQGQLFVDAAGVVRFELGSS